MSKEERPKFPFPPLWLQEKISKENGTEATLITKTKILTKTDLCKGQSRLLLPKELRGEILTEAEKLILQEKSAGTKPGISVDFFDPLWNKHEIELKKRKKSLVLTKWVSVIESYGKFKEKQSYVFCCFRSETNKLCFCLVTDQKESYVGDSEDVKSNLEKELESESGDKDETYDSLKELDIDSGYEDEDETDDDSLKELDSDSGYKDETDDVVPGLD